MTSSYDEYTAAQLRGVDQLVCIAYDQQFSNAATKPMVFADDSTRSAHVTVIVPARNESREITRTITALLAQDRAPDDIIIVANNCTDNTADVARQYPVTVIDMPSNVHKKAGAINEALRQVLPEMRDDDVILIQDADTRLNPEFITCALDAMAPDIGGVCAQYDSSDPQNLLERLQSNEFARSRRSIARKGGETKILVGIASVFRVSVLREVVEARRSGKIAGAPEVYSRLSLTEDYELTLALKTLGYRLVCPPGCRPETDAMSTVKALWGQRVRWSRGGLDDLHVYGPSKVTRRYIAAQVSRVLVMMTPLLYGLYLLSLQLTYGSIQWDRTWMLVNVILIGERIWTVRDEGWRAMGIAALVIPEMMYDWFMSATYIDGMIKHLGDVDHHWAET